MEELSKRINKVEFDVSHAKRTATENGKKIDSVLKSVTSIDKSFNVLMSDLKGEKGYLKQIDENTDTIDRNTFKIDKTQTLLIRIGIAFFTLGALFAWIVSQYRIEEKIRASSYFHEFYNKPIGIHKNLIKGEFKL